MQIFFQIFEGPVSVSCHFRDISLNSTFWTEISLTASQQTKEDPISAKVNLLTSTDGENLQENFEWSLNDDVCTWTYGERRVEGESVFDNSALSLYSKSPIKLNVAVIAADREDSRAIVTLHQMHERERTSVSATVSFNKP